MASELESLQLRHSALTMQLEVQRVELQAVREKQKAQEDMVIQEQERDWS